MMKRKYGRTVLALLLCISTFFVHVTAYARGGEDTLPPDESAALSDSMHRIKTSMAAEMEAAESAETKTEGTEAKARVVAASDDTGSYTDSHGITYKYYLYDGDKLNIYEITGYEGEKKLMSIPMEISSYKVTQITACLSYGAELDSLTIPDTVTYVGEGAFSGVKIGTLYYNAVEASTTENFSTAPFASAEIHELHIGDYVTEIPDFMFSNAHLTQDEINLKVSRIGRGAFYNSITATDLVIGEGVKDIGSNAFHSANITNLYYNAINATVGGDAAVGAADSPFCGVTLSGISFGEKVESIPRCLFSHAKFSVESLGLPDSVTSIGTMAFCALSSGDITIRDLVIGENISYIGASAFSRCTIEQAVVYALKADDDFKVLSFTSDELPVCASVEIHTGSDFYRYFTDRIPADSVTSMCKTFETVYGEEYYDDETNSFITPYEEDCIVCGYGTEGKNSVAAFTVKFLDYDGSVIKIQHVKRGEAATAPENPSRPAEEWGTWEFKGWNGNYENVLKDETVQAVFEKKLYTYTVIFMSEGKILDTQSVKYGEAAVPPSDPKKEADGEYSYTFTGWDGDYSYITGDIKIYAKFEKEKLPPGGPGDGGEEPDDDKPGSGSGDTKPEDDDKKPGTGDTKPGDDGKDPGDNTESGDGSPNSGNDTESGDSSQNPDNDTESDNGSKESGNNTESNNGGKKPDNNTEPRPKEPGNGHTSDAGKTPNPPAPGTEIGRIPEPQVTDTGKPDAETTQTETDDTEGTEDTEDTDNAGDTETTLQDKEDAGDNYLWLVFAALAVLFLIWLLLLLLLLLCYGEKICGTVRKCGEPVNGLRIMLKRPDKKNGYEIQTVSTDKDGAFCFSGLHKDIYRLGFLGKAGQSAFSMDIHMGEKEKNIFTVLATCHDVETAKKGRKYVVDVEA